MQSTPQITLGDRLRRAMKNADIPATEMAKRLGLSRNSVSAYLGDRQRPAMPVLLVWAQLTGVPLAWLLGEDERSDVA